MRAFDPTSRKDIATLAIGTAIGLSNEYLYKHYYKKASFTKKEFRLLIPWFISYISRDVLCYMSEEFFGNIINFSHNRSRYCSLRMYALFANWACYLYNDDDQLCK